jgi:actin-related protein
MFEKFNINRIQYGYQALMTLYSEGMETALLLDLGDGVSHCLPIFSGNMIRPRF